MFTLTMRFTLPEDTDWSKIPAIMEDRARNLYLNMPGLISKAFVYDPDTREYGGNYLWERREQIDTFLKSDIVAGARQKFGEPTYRIHQVAAYLDRGKVYVPAASPTA
jgi:hypothetical protein